ncbi:IDEAL domain-containing protein, partial [Staphylococcus hominis]
LIEEALRNAKKAKLKLLIDEALINKDENYFIL